MVFAPLPILRFELLDALLFDGQQLALYRAHGTLGVIRSLPAPNSPLTQFHRPAYRLTDHP